MHLAAEGYVIREINAANIKEFITEAAASPTPPMTVVVGPNVKVTKFGYVGWAIIAESHITVHYYTSNRNLWLDFFSCTEFDVGVVMALARKLLGFQEMNRAILPRGLEQFP